MNTNERFLRTVSAFLSLCSIRLSDDVASALKTLAENETDETAKTMYRCITDDLALADRLHRPICQDTGMLQFFLDVGTGFPFLNEIETVLTEAVRLATKETPLRPNAVSPIGETNTGDNTGFGAPYIETHLVPDNSDLRIRLYLSGGGCSLPGRSKVLMPLEGVKGIKQFVYETVTAWGVNACPPLNVGIGIGADAAVAAKLSKQALLREVGSRNPDPELAALEETIRQDLDALGIAPLGFGGSKTGLGVNIEAAARHPATLGVGLSFGCWATRHGEIILHPDLSYELVSHKNTSLPGADAEQTGRQTQ